MSIISTSTGTDTWQQRAARDDHGKQHTLLGIGQRPA